MQDNYEAWVLKLNADGSVAWQKTYAGSAEASSAQQTADGGFIVVGEGDVNSDDWVLKLNADGSPVWRKTYGVFLGGYDQSVHQTADGGYVVAGTTYNFGPSENDAWVLKLNADGSVAWQKSYGGSREDRAHSIQQTADGGFIIAGLTLSFGAGNYDAWVLKLNADGSIAWQKTYGGSQYDEVTSVQQTADGDYILAGKTFSFARKYGTRGC